jgi:hypothetical protein
MWSGNARCGLDDDGSSSGRVPLVKHFNPKSSSTNNFPAAAGERTVYTPIWTISLRSVSSGPIHASKPVLPGSDLLHQLAANESLVKQYREDIALEELSNCLCIDRRHWLKLAVRQEPFACRDSMNMRLPSKKLVQQCLKMQVRNSGTMDSNPSGCYSARHGHNHRSSEEILESRLRAYIFYCAYPQAGFSSINLILPSGRLSAIID